MLNFILPLLMLALLSACKGGASGDTGNQFKVTRGMLYFDNKALVSWPENLIPVCKQCTSNSFAKRMPSGPILFQQINDERGELILLNVKKARHSFALNTGLEQHSMRLKLLDDVISASIDQSDFFVLNNNKVMAIRIDDKHYKIRLNKLNIAKKTPKGKASEQSPYEADITIWAAKG